MLKLIQKQLLSSGCQTVNNNVSYHNKETTEENNKQWSFEFGGSLIFNYPVLDRTWSLSV